ncbi:Tyrosine-protein phosphatase non-receptor type 13 [Acipenser ruthenus]|uniref:Tyrosine-protein phosphatase non-receptor type 13 n=1 Tax=Acipenser ruthenus TaxID=7906 RepID=A0A444UUE4_ACIRT|nr:Tyrosine-protein phosphatase non-receptor type 13 [Acipenser ruthenus]
MNRQYELPSEENLVSQEMMLKRQEQEMQRLQAQMAHRRFKLSLYPGDLPRASMLDVTRDPLRDIALETTLTQRKLKVVVVLHINSKAKKVVPVHGKAYFRLEHYLATTVLEKVDQSFIKEELPKLHSTYFGASEKETEFEFLKVCQKLPEYGVHFHRVLPEKKSQTGIMLGVCSKGVLIFEMHNGARTPVLRFPWRETKKISFTVHGKAYFRLEHYLATTVLEKVDQSFIKEELPKLHSTYFGASEKETEFEFLKVCQKLPEYGVHFHRVLPEKKSQTGIMLGVCSKGVLIFEMHNGARTPVLRFPWRETKKISFTVRPLWFLRFCLEENRANNRFGCVCSILTDLIVSWKCPLSAFGFDFESFKNVQEVVDK